MTSSSSEAHSKERTRLISRDNLFREALTKNISQIGPMDLGGDAKDSTGYLKVGGLF